jgi:hypothetical protein
VLFYKKLSTALIIWVSLFLKIGLLNPLQSVKSEQFILTRGTFTTSGKNKISVGYFLSVMSTDPIKSKISEYRYLVLKEIQYLVPILVKAAIFLIFK